MSHKYILALLVLTSLSCSQADSSEYQLSEELKQQAQAVKKEMLEGNSEAIAEKPENTLLKGENQQNSPEWVLKQVFKAARTGDFSMLSQLCDPTGEVDTNSKRLCDVASTQEGDQQDFMDYFKRGKIAGKAFINADSASVPMKFGYDGSTDATIKFVKRNGNWYMSSF